MAGKVLPLGPATFPDMVEDFQKEVELLKLVGEPLALCQESSSQPGTRPLCASTAPGACSLRARSAT